MSNIVEFTWSDQSELPRIPAALIYVDTTVAVNVLLDTGSTVNLLPYEIGQQLGAVWEQHTIKLPLAGNLANTEARGIFINVKIGHLEPVRLAFAWAATSQIPLIFGQTNFFREFDVCFQRSRRVIEITRT